MAMLLRFARAMPDTFLTDSIARNLEHASERVCRYILQVCALALARRPS